jgi:hypothetical protein
VQKKSARKFFKKMDFSILIVSLVRQSNETPAETKLSDLKFSAKVLTTRFPTILGWF